MYQFEAGITWTALCKPRPIDIALAVFYERDQYLYDDKVYFTDGRCYVNTE